MTNAPLTSPTPSSNAVAPSPRLPNLPVKHFSVELCRARNVRRRNFEITNLAVGECRSHNRLPFYPARRYFASTRVRFYPLPPAMPPRHADYPTPPNSKTAPNSPGRGSCPRPPCSTHPRAACPSPARPHTADKNKSAAPPTSAAASLPPSGQTCKPRPTCVQLQSRAGTANKI